MNRPCYRAVRGGNYEKEFYMNPHLRRLLSADSRVYFFVCFDYKQTMLPGNEDDMKRV